MLETPNLEYKREYTKTFLKTVSAFANYGTGRVVFGVDDDGTRIGLKDLADCASRIENAINDSLSPVPHFAIDVDEGAHTVELIVFEGDMKPYLYAGKAYRRANSSTVSVGRLEHNRLTLIGSNTSFDALESARQSLSFDILGTELADKMGLSVLDKNALISLELCDANGTFNNAAALLADKNQFPGTDIARFGDNINTIHSRKSLDGASLLLQMRQALDMFEEYYSYEEISGSVRTQRCDVPRAAFREAVANALVHRCWNVRASVKIGMFADRIEISSPGGLPDGITEEEYLAGGLAVSRNPILANVFYRLGYIERFGTGIPRIVHEYEQLDVAPRFIVREASICVILPAESGTVLTPDERRIFAVLPKGVLLSRAEIAAELGMSKDKTIRLLGALANHGLVERRGSGRATRYLRS